MNHSAWKTTLLTALLAFPPAALLTAQPAPPPPAPEAPRAVPAPPPEAPEPPVPPAPPRARRQKVVVESPDQEIVVDGDRILIDGDEFDPEAFADLEVFDGHPFAWKAHGRGTGFIGMQPVEMTPELRQHFGAPKDAGVFVGSVEKDGPAAKAGLQVGDIVTKVDGDTIASRRELVREIRHRKPGETVSIELLRNRAAKTVSVTVAERKEREVRVGEWNGWDHGRGSNWNWDWNRELPDPDFPKLEQRMKDLEKKLKELERRLPNQ
ncbi:MAG: S1C family serine protease [Syntrophomonadaceae bacterium]